MKPVTAALLSAAATLVLAGGVFFAVEDAGIWTLQSNRLPLPQGTGVISAGPDIGSEVRDYLAAHPELLRGTGAAASASNPPVPTTALSTIASSGVSSPGLSTPVISSTFSPTQKLEIAAVVREFLLANPELVRDAMDALDRKNAADQAEAQKKAIADNKATIFSAPAPRQVVLGNPDGDVTLVEFFDYNCTYCRRAQADMRSLIENDKKLRVVLKEFPVLGPGSVEAAQVAVALNIVAPEKYEAFHDRMLTDSAQASGERALAIAEAVGVDPDSLRSTMKDGRIGQTIDEVYAVADFLGLSGTPSYVLGNEVVVGAVGLDALKQKIAAVRDCGTGTC